VLGVLGMRVMRVVRVMRVMKDGGGGGGGGGGDAGIAPWSCRCRNFIFTSKLDGTTNTPTNITHTSTCIMRMGKAMRGKRG